VSPRCWYLVCLFLWVAENRADGNLGGMTAEDIEIAAGWTGEPGEFTHALIDVGFLDGADGAYVVHDWLEHIPGQPIVPNVRRQPRTRQTYAGHALAMRPTCPSHANRMRMAIRTACGMQCPPPDPTQPNQTHP
jgi:hypothetical protein